MESGSVSSTPTIRVTDLHKAYLMGDQTLWALKGVDCTIEKGEFTAVMGPSGSGKSTFMNLVGCLDRPTKGRIEIDGQDVSNLDARSLAAVRNIKIGFVFQQFNLLARTSALDNVCLPLLYSGAPEKTWRERAEASLERVGLADRMHHHPSQLSGGQQQRVAIARALINDPVMILADEPTGALDTQTSAEVMSLFEELNAAGTTIILVTHEPEVAAHARRQLVFRDGLLILDEATDSLQSLDLRNPQLAKVQSA